MTVTKAPWTEDQVAALQSHQENPRVHPYTCTQRDLPGHKEYAQKNGQYDHGMLVPTPNGWVCPVCSYTQNWAFMFTLDGSS